MRQSVEKKQCRTPPRYVSRRSQPKLVHSLYGDRNARLSCQRQAQQPEPVSELARESFACRCRGFRHQNGSLHAALREALVFDPRPRVIRDTAHLRGVSSMPWKPGQQKSGVRDAQRGWQRLWAAKTPSSRALLRCLRAVRSSRSSCSSLAVGKLSCPKKGCEDSCPAQGSAARTRPR